MPDIRKAAEQALEALEDPLSFAKGQAAAISIRAALSQPAEAQGEPVAAAQPVQVPEGAPAGWKLVPVEELQELVKLTNFNTSALAAHVSAMATAWLAAAPLPPAQTENAERIERLKFDLRQVMIDYGAAERANDPERIRSTTSAAVALIDSLAPVVDPKSSPEPAQPVNRRLLEALRPFAVYGRPGSRDVEVGEAIAAIAEAEAQAAQSVGREALSDQATVDLVKECHAALAEELGAWDIDPPLHHVKQAHDRCEEWLRAHGITGEGV